DPCLFFYDINPILKEIKKSHHAFESIEFDENQRLIPVTINEIVSHVEAKVFDNNEVERRLKDRMIYIQEGRQLLKHILAIDTNVINHKFHEASIIFGVVFLLFKIAVPLGIVLYFA